MTNYIKHIAILPLFALLICMPIEVKAQNVQRTQTEMEQNPISVTVSESTLHVKNADHMTLEVFSITGDKVYSIRIDSPSKNIELENLSRGCYIVRIGKFTRKIYIR